MHWAFRVVFQIPGVGRAQFVGVVGLRLSAPRGPAQFLGVWPSPCAVLMAARSFRARRRVSCTYVCVQVCMENMHACGHVMVQGHPVTCAVFCWLEAVTVLPTFQGSIWDSDAGPQHVKFLD